MELRSDYDRILFLEVCWKRQPQFIDVGPTLEAFGRKQKERLDLSRNRTRTYRQRSDSAINELTTFGMHCARSYRQLKFDTKVSMNE